MRQRHSCISHGSNVEGAILFENTMRCSLGMQECAMHNATIQKTTFFFFRFFFIHIIIMCVQC